MHGNEIKQHRIERNLTQEQLAKKANMPQRTISYMESNKSNPTLSNLITLADFYGITIDELIGREPKKNGLY